jgi:hypothetical protein
VPWRHKRAWRSSTTILDLGIKWRWVFSSSSRPFYSWARTHGTHWLSGWMYNTIGLEAAEKKTTLPLPRFERRQSSPWLVKIPTELSDSCYDNNTNYPTSFLLHHLQLTASLNKLQVNTNIWLPTETVEWINALSLWPKGDRGLSDSVALTMRQLLLHFRVTGQYTRSFAGVKLACRELCWIYFNMKSTIFWDITPCSPLTVIQNFGGIYRFHLQVRIRRARYERESR